MKITTSINHQRESWGVADASLNHQNQYAIVEMLLMYINAGRTTESNPRRLASACSRRALRKQPAICKADS